MHDPLNRAYSLAVQVGNQEQEGTSLHLMAVAYRMLIEHSTEMYCSPRSSACYSNYGDGDSDRGYDKEHSYG
jgi:hypothetical protein